MGKNLMRNKFQIVGLQPGSVVSVFMQDENGNYTKQAAMEDNSSGSFQLKYNDKLVGKELLVKIANILTCKCEETKVKLEKRSTVFKPKSVGKER